MSYCHFWNNLGLLGILFSISLVVFAENQIYWRLKSKLVAVYISSVFIYYHSFLSWEKENCKNYRKKSYAFF